LLNISTEVRWLISWVTSNSVNITLAKADYKALELLFKHTSVSSGTLGMYNTLWNTLTIKMGQQVNQVEILEQERTILSNSLVSLRVCHGASIGGRVDWLLRILEGRGGFIVGNHG
jgi:hypothetical protein